MAKIETIVVDEGQTFPLAFQDEVVSVLFPKVPSKESGFRVTILRRGV